MSNERSHHPSVDSPPAPNATANNSFPSDNPNRSDEAPATQKGDRAGMKSEHILDRLLGDKNAEWQSLANKEGPLHFLDLPVEVLNLIFKEV